MPAFLQILINIIFPVFALIGVGALLDRTFKPDLPTLSRLNFYVFVPALVFTRLLGSPLDGEMIGLVLGFNLVHLVILLAASWLLFGLPAFRRYRPLLIASTLFNNSGNYGLPFAQLAFGDFGVQVMAFVLVFQNVISFTLGLWLLGSEKEGWQQRLMNTLKAPVLYAVVAAFLLNALRVELPAPLLFPLTQLGNALIPIALLTLGVQLSRVSWDGQAGILAIAGVMRLVVAPLAALGLAWVWRGAIPVRVDMVFPVLVCAAALPTAVNVYILAAECNHKPALASQIVFWSTLASAVTLPIWLMIFT